jgi:hypothetical protein
MYKFVKLFVDEEHVLKSNRGRRNTLTNSTRKRHKKEDTAISIKHRILETFDTNKKDQF